MPGPVQPVPLVSVQDQQLEERPERPDIANVEDALVEAEVQVEEVDPKVAEAAAAMERVTVEKPANVNKGSAGKAIKVTSNYIRFVVQVTFDLQIFNECLQAGAGGGGEEDVRV